MDDSRSYTSTQAILPTGRDGLNLCSQHKRANALRLPKVARLDADDGDHPVQCCIQFVQMSSPNLPQTAELHKNPSNASRKRVSMQHHSNAVKIYYTHVETRKVLSSAWQAIILIMITLFSSDAHPSGRLSIRV